MTDHLPVPILNALADGELSADQLAAANEHLSQCPSCTSDALYQSLLKSATAKAGQRYAPPANLQARLALQVREELPLHDASRVNNARPVMRSSSFYGWGGAGGRL